MLLYEMVTGRKHFADDTPLRTLSSILKDTPPSVVDIAPGCPPELSRIIDRCLRKDPERRWQHIQDVRIALLELKEESDSGRLVAAPLQQPAARASVLGKRWAVAAATAIVAAAVPGWWLLTRGRAADTTPVEFASMPLTTFPGDERDPSFSPNGDPSSDFAGSWSVRQRGVFSI